MSYYGSTPKIAPMPFELTFAYEKLTQAASSTQSTNNLKKYNYFSVGRDIKENPKEAVKTTRQILHASLQIQDQQCETHRLKEYLMMEEQKLELVQYELERTKEDFKARCLEDDKETKDIVHKVKQSQLESQSLSREKEDLVLRLQHTEDCIKKTEEELDVKKQLKHFLDVLSIQAGIKDYNPRIKLGIPRQSTEDSSVELGDTPKNSLKFLNDMKKKTTFMTQTQQDISENLKKLLRKKNLGHKKLSSNSKNRKKSIHSSENKHKEFDNGNESNTQVLTDHQRAIIYNPQENLYFSDEYSDDDFEIYFNNRTIKRYIDEIEEDLLFKINQVQDLEYVLEKVQTRNAKEKKFLQSQIADLTNNIAYSSKILEDRKQKQDYFEEELQDQQSLSKSCSKESLESYKKIQEMPASDKSKAALELLYSIDPDASDERVAKFFGLLQSLCDMLKVQINPREMIIEAMAKIEH